MRRTTDGRTDGRLLSRKSQHQRSKIGRERERERSAILLLTTETQKVVCVIMTLPLQLCGITTTTTTTTSTLAPPKPGGKIGIGRRTDAPSRRVFCPSKVSRICRKKRRKGGGGKGGPEEEEPLSNMMGEYETWDGDDDEEALDDDDGGDGGDISNNGGGDDDDGGGDDEDDDEDDDEFDETWETIIKRLEDNYQNLEAVKTAGDPYAGLNGVSGELSVLWSAGCVVTYCSAIAHSLDTVISPRDGCVDIA